MDNYIHCPCGWSGDEYRAELVGNKYKCPVCFKEIDWDWEG